MQIRVPGGLGASCYYSLFVVMSVSQKQKSKQSESVSMSRRLLIDLKSEFQRCDDVICTGRERKKTKQNCTLKV